MKQFFGIFLLQVAICNLQPVILNAQSIASVVIDSANSITTSQVKYFIGKEKIVCGKVVRVFCAAKNKNKPTFLDVDIPYPNEPLSIVIYDNVRAKLKKTPENYMSKNVCIKGTLKIYAGRVQIILENESQIISVDTASETTKQNFIKENIATEENLSRGGGDPLKGLNVSKTNDMVIGNYYALIIGIDNYNGSWKQLKNAVNDAKAVETLLKEEYKIDYCKTLYNEAATRNNIITEIEWFANNVKGKDNVLIYYSGHGEYKKEFEKGYWVPVDATSSSVSDYISNNDLQAFLVGIKSKHTLLISDACFSGDVMRGNTIAVPFEDSEKYYRTVHARNSRKAITSGSIEPVMDGGRDGHSVFTYYLINTLIKNQSKYFDASQLYEQLKIPVVNNSEQSPQFSPINNTGDNGGQFIFIRK